MRRRGVAFTPARACEPIQLDAGAYPVCTCGLPLKFDYRRNEQEAGFVDEGAGLDIWGSADAPYRLTNWWRHA
jgi:hypothetical protein